VRAGLALYLVLGAAGCRPCAPSQPIPAVNGARREVIFHGMCDASGAVALSPRMFAVADDEDNALRVYDPDRGGAPLGSVDVSDGLDLRRASAGKKKKKKQKPKKKAPETDIEAATRLGDHAFWITSHARSSSGKLKDARLRFFATNVPQRGIEMEVVGQPYETLITDLIADPRFTRFELARAAELGPKTPGGLNIEGMTEREQGGVFIGFRNPIPNGQALIVPLLNPDQVILGAPPQFGDPLALDLGGLGVRSLSWWRGRYLIIAGHYDSGAPSRLYVWDGRRAPRHVAAFSFDRFNPEGFFSPEEREEILLLSDDGGRAIGSEDCKQLEDSADKRFRGVWLKLPRGS